jgi:outer membrane protein
MLMCIFVQAQESAMWTLEKCINQALEQNIDLKIQQNLEQKAVYDRRQSQWDMVPSLNGWGNSNFDFRRSTNQNNDISSGTTYNVGYGVSSSMNLFAGFTSWNTIAANRYNEMACGEETKLASNTLKIAIINLFSKVIYQQALVKVAKEKLDVSLAESKRIAATIETGQMEPVAQSEINATVSGNKLALSQAENEYQLLKLRLAQLIELPENTNFTISSLEIEAQIPDENMQTLDSVYAAACQNYPSVLKKEYELDYYRKQLHISRGKMAPSIKLSGSYSSGFYSTDTLANGKQTPVEAQFNNYLNPSVGVSLSIPILNGRYYNFQEKKSRIDLENAMYNLDNQKKLIRREIENALQQLEAFNIEYQHASDNLKFAKLSFETYREKYRLGLINTTDFMNAQNQLSLAQSEVLRAHYSWFVQLETIKLYEGRR